MTDRTDIPSPKAPNFEQRVRETLMTYLGRQGNPLDRGLTLRDLIETGVLKIRDGYQLRPGAGTVPLQPGDGVVDVYEPDLTPPPAPATFTATAAISHVLIEHEAPIYRQGHGHLRTRLYGKIVNAGDPLPTFSDAIEIAQFSGTVYAFPANPATTWRFWIKWETVDGVLSPDPAGGTNGVEAITGQDVAQLLTALTGEITEGQLYQDLNTRIDLIDDPATGLVKKVGDLETVYGSTVSAASSAAAAAQSASDATAAKAAAILAQTGAETAKQTAEGAATTATTKAAEASTSATSASQSATSAAGSASSAATSASTASTAATNAGNSASAAATSASSAATYATNAETASTAATSAKVAAEAASSAAATSATAAATDASTATTKATEASQSALAASTSATNASTSASNAATSATQAATSKTNAAGSASSASTSASAAATSATNASNSATAAATSASTATTKATEAAQSASAASTSATNASTSASSAGVSASNAATSETNAAGSASSAATSLTTVQAIVGDAETLSALIETEATTRASETGSLFAQYTVKVDTNGFVSGFGLASQTVNGVPVSDFQIRADRFSITNPSIALVTVSTLTRSTTTATLTTSAAHGLVVGDTFTLRGVTNDTSWNGAYTVLTRPSAAEITFTVADTLTTPATGTIKVGKTAIPFIVDGGVVYMAAAMIQDATITSAKIANLAVDDAKIASITADKLLTGSIAVGQHIQSTDYVSGTTGWRIGGDGNAELSNAIVRGTVYATDGQFVGEVIAQDAGGNKARMWAGDFEIYKQVPNIGQVLYKALSRVESGVGANNVQVTIPGYFLNQPRVIVSPANIKLYDSAYANQSQSIQCEVRDLIESPAGSMVWKFTPLATLSLAANTGQTVINQTSGTISTNWTSSQYTTQANTKKVTPSVRLASYRGNGASQWYLRTVRWRLEYLSGGSWIADSWTTINLGADTNASVDSDKLFTFPSSGTWTFRIAFEAYDYSPSTLFGSIEYNYHTGTVSAAGPAAVQDYRLGTYNTTLTLPGFSPPAGYSVYQVDYSVNWSWSRNGTNGSVTVDGSLVKASTSTGTSGSGTKTRTSSSYNVNELDLSMQITALGSGFGGENMYAQLSNGSATINSRQAKPNSTTAANTFSLNSYTYELSSAQVLATGTLNWVAIGE